MDSRVHTIDMPVADGTYRIGELAAQSGLTPDALRYYERLGLLPAPARSPGGFRLYSDTALDRLRFIKRAQLLDFRLAEIHELVSFNGRGGLRRCRRVHDLLSRKVAALDAKLKALTALQKTLKATQRQCAQALTTEDATACPVIEFSEP